MAFNILDAPPEIILHIFSFLDLPDLEVLTRIAPPLLKLSQDPALHKNRIRVVAPSRLRHSLFGQGPQGVPLRPTIGDLVHRGVMRGLSIERRWRMGIYFHSHLSVRQYEMSLLLQRQHIISVVASFLRQRTSNFESLRSLHLSHIMPDVESSSLGVSRMLLPVMRKLKWSLKRDQLSKVVREGSCMITVLGASADGSGFAKWLESHGHHRVVQEDHSGRVRLAVCPDVRKIIGIFEALSR